MKSKLNVDEINEVACLDRYMKKHSLSKAQLAKDLGIAAQFISRVFTQEDRTQLPPALKFALLKYYYYDVETDTELGNSLNQNVTKVYFYAYGIDNIKDEELKSTEYIYFDTRWLTNILGVDPENVIMYQLQEDSMEKFHMHPMMIHYRLHIDDIVMVDKSVKSSNRRAFFLVSEDGKLQVKCLSMDWDGSNVTEYMAASPEKETATVIPHRRIQGIKNNNLEIIGKVIWNANSKFYR